MTASTYGTTSRPVTRSAGRLDTVVRLIQANLALSALLALLTALFHDSLLDFQLAARGLPPTEEVRSALSQALWWQVIPIVLIGVITLFLIRGLRAGRRRAYLRVLVLSVVNVASIGFLVWSGQYPVWLDAGQVLRGLVLLALLWAATRAPVRAHFARR